jgi:ubiquinone/menaquinone biosynthesis C-methylase UbiE
VQLADVHHLPFRDGTIDLILGRSVVHHWAQPERALRELYRVLAPDGRAVMHEPVRDADPAALGVFNQGRRAMGLPEMSLREKYTVSELESHLERAGIRAQSRLIPGEGLAALGCELYIRKRGDLP